jgi:hypothetical protein
MPCVVARIYIVLLVVLERGVRVRRNCNIFNLAMENVLKRWQILISVNRDLDFFLFSEIRDQFSSMEKVFKIHVDVNLQYFFLQFTSVF